MSGGLGNQMFQYAFGISMAERYHRDLYLDTYFYTKHPERTFELDVYNVPYKGKSVYKSYNQIRLYVQRIPFLSAAMGIIKEKKEYSFDKRVNKRAYKYYTGYWQNLRYLEGMKGRLQDFFSYQGELTELQKKLIIDMVNEESVAVHVRHGDYQSPKFNKVYYLLTEKYYQNAIGYIDKHCKSKELKFYFFSDDIEWCKNTFSAIKDAVFVDQSISNNQHIDFMLMKKCKHIIIANSTYSWWAAWLKEQAGIVVAPSNWYFDENKNLDAVKALIEPDWVTVDDI